MEANQLVAITDVTEKIKGATKGLDGAEFIRAQRAAMSGIEKECSSDKVYRCDLYHLYKYRTYRDVRLVFVPEHDIAFFGGDPDNFNFPRYNLDMAILRVYDDGKPLKSDEHFTWSASGPKEGDAIFVPGNPGGTDRLLTVAQLEYMRDVQYPISLQRNAEMRGILEQFGKLGEEQTRISQDELLFLENGIKVQRGEFAALVDKRAFAEKVKAE